MQRCLCVRIGGKVSPANPLFCVPCTTGVTSVALMITRVLRRLKGLPDVALLGEMLRNSFAPTFGCVHKKLVASPSTSF